MNKQECDLNKKLKCVITAGPTREFIDPVRFLSNPSSGKMGYAIAEAARDCGLEVCLISGPTALAAPKNVDIVSVVSAEEMHRAVIEYCVSADILIMSAAVCDYTPVTTFRQKIKKSDSELTLIMKRTKDILLSVSQSQFCGTLVGFAAESEFLEKNALDKLHKKNLNMIIANDITQNGAGFASDTNIVTIFTDANDKVILPQMPKKQLARCLIACIMMYREGKRIIVSEIQHFIQ